MFPYFGSKKKLAPQYPQPVYDKIIEPFAGSAQYACLHWEKEVLLYDTFEPIARTWEYLIQATEDDILGLPDLAVGESLNDFNWLTDEEKMVIGWYLSGWSETPKQQRTSRGEWPRQKQELADDIHKIKHWKVCCNSYENIPNQLATWFVDPPYQGAGKEYYHHNIRYNHLGDWCKERRGQTIVCENYGANWLPFEVFSLMRGSTRSTIEAIWCSG